MTTLSASDVAALRIREARRKRGWNVQQLADRCRAADVPGLTAAVITNLETRRRPGREITADELLALAWVLGVPPVQLLAPLDDRERLQIVPGVEKGPLDAIPWLADDDAVLLAVPPAESGDAGDTERTLRYRGNPLAVIRQIRASARALRKHDRALSGGRWREVIGGTENEHVNAISVLALKLAHLARSLEALGYAPPPLDGPSAAAGILARHGQPVTLDEWELDGEEVSGGAS